MNIQELTFGVEIECFLPSGQIDFSVGSYHHGRQIPALPIGWNSRSDISIDADPGYRAIEIVSPILKGVDGLNQIKLVCDWLRSKGAKVNHSCGLHVHIGFRNHSARQLAQLVSIVAKNEKALFAITGTKSREIPRPGRPNYCKAIQNDFRSIGHRGNTRGNLAVGDRYHLLNLAPLTNGSRPAVEFRCFAGTTNYIKIHGCVQVCAGLVQKGALTTKAKIKYDATPLADKSRVTKQGEGETAANRLFYQLFWKFGDEFRPTSTDPKWTPLGVIDPATVERSGKLLLKLARKYDGNDVADPVEPTPPTAS